MEAPNSGISYSQIEVNSQYTLEYKKICVTGKHLAIIHNLDTGDSSGREERISYYYLNDRSTKYTAPFKSLKITACFRCGRKSHYASQCYASTHVNGYQLSDDEED